MFWNKKNKEVLAEEKKNEYQVIIQTGDWKHSFYCEKKDEADILLDEIQELLNFKKTDFIKVRTKLIKRDNITHVFIKVV
jgi:hypothetical protein